MNYIAEIKAFNDFAMTNPLSTGQIALWYALMHINNRCAWAEWFSVPNLTLELLTGLTRRAILNARNALKQYGLIDFKANGTRATKYKVVSMVNNSQGTSQGTSQATSQGTSQDTSQGTSTLNKLNKTIIPPYTPQGADVAKSDAAKSADSRFDEFWAAYPKKVGKAAAKKAYGRVKPTAELHEQMLRAIDTAKRSDQWQRDNGQYIPHPTTWLNRGGWDDELEVQEERRYKRFD